ncbi:MAG: hypothetical protein AABW88_01440 [Nanoarchaeota archaeon]
MKKETKHISLSYITPSGERVAYRFLENSPIYHMVRDILKEMLTEKGLPETSANPKTGNIPNVMFSADESHMHKDLTDLLLMDSALLIDEGTEKLGNNKTKVYSVHNYGTRFNEQIRNSKQILSGIEVLKLFARYNSPSHSVLTGRLEQMVRGGFIQPESVVDAQEYRN